MILSRVIGGLTERKGRIIKYSQLFKNPENLNGRGFFLGLGECNYMLKIKFFSLDKQL